MRRHGYVAHVPIGLLLAFLFVFVGGGGPANARACTQRASAVRDTPLYQQAPQFITGRGVVYGRQVSVLWQGISVFICDQVTIGLWPAGQLWYRIAFWNKAWSYAWASARDIRVEGSGSAGPHPAALPAALAAPGPAGPPLTSAQSLPAIGPPQAPPPGQTPPPPPPIFEATAPTDESPLLVFYGISFVAIVIGMVAKTLVDIFGSSEPAKPGRLIRSTMVPLLVSPMVFLGFMQSASLTVRGISGFIVLLCLAFQSGFFWQTVMSIKKPQ